jgi:hypothetical protein
VIARSRSWDCIIRATILLLFLIFLFLASTPVDGPLATRSNGKSQVGDRSPYAILNPCSPHFRPPRRPQIPSP